MTCVLDESRRRLLKLVALGAVLTAPVGATLEAAAAELPLVGRDDPTAKALKYTSDAGQAPDAKPGSRCANCSLYQGGAGAQGGCLLFPGKAVKAAGWCASWTAKPT